MKANGRRKVFKYPYSIVPRYRDILVKIAEKDAGLLNALENEVEDYTFSIKVEELHEIYPLDEARPSRYIAIVNYLKTIFNVTMIVLPRVRRAEVINLINLKDESKESE